MKLAAIIVTYNRKDLLMKCLDGVLQQTHPVDAVVLVDNGSTDGTAETLNQDGRFFRDSFHYLRLENNVGAAGGYLSGIKYAYEHGYDWFWIMNDDAVPKPTALENLRRYAARHTGQKLGGLVSFQTHWNPKLLRFGLPRSIWQGLVYYVACPIDMSNADRVAVSLDWCTLMSFLMPKEVVEHVGWPREEFYHYFDDMDYTIRIRKAGYPIYLILDSLVDHITGHDLDRTLGRQSSWRTYYLYRNQIANIIIHRDYIRRSNAMAALTRITLGAVRRMCLFMAHNEYGAAKLVMEAIRDGYSLKLGEYRHKDGMTPEESCNPGI